LIGFGRLPDPNQERICKALTKAAPRKCNIPMADANANLPNTVHFRIEVFIPEQRGYAF